MMIVRTATFLLIAAISCGCSRPPNPESELGKKIYALMVQYETTSGPIDLSSEICGELDEVVLQALAVEMPELQPTINLNVTASPLAPGGSTAVGFSRPVGGLEGLFRSQGMDIVVKSDVNFCRVQLVIRSI